MRLFRGIETEVHEGMESISARVTETSDRIELTATVGLIAFTLVAAVAVSALFLALEAGK